MSASRSRVGLSGSSPPARGSQLRRDDTALLGRSIPAHAGNTDPRSGFRPCRPVDPRLCGAHWPFRRHTAVNRSILAFARSPRASLGSGARTGFIAAGTGPSGTLGVPPYMGGRSLPLQGRQTSGRSRSGPAMVDPHPCGAGHDPRGDAGDGRRIPACAGAATHLHTSPPDNRSIPARSRIPNPMRRSPVDT